MESQQRVQFHIYDNVAIILILLAGIGIEVGRCEPNSESNNFNTNVSCSFKKHLLTSYFEKYECLLDSNFQDFITNELHFRMCEVLPDDLRLVIRPSVLQRHLIGEGSHRHLSSSIRFDIDPKAVSQLSIHYCEVIFVERLPSGVFADPFELQHLLQRGVFADVAVFGDTNLELPSFLSNRSAVEVHMKVDPNSLSTHKNGFEIKVDLPLHARYQRLDEGGYSTVEFGDPDMFMQCCLEGKSHNQSCYIPTSNNGTEPKIGAAVWRIPSGIKGHEGVVSVVTFISAFLSTLLIVLTSIFLSDIKRCKSSKQL
ncbi:hypothetical protein Dsin_004410 [Dipteronia sinensis]|uniref:Phosphatidylinositol-glycan biosynthesis class X protein n=1 Tax=Dipteronia sinensis TaxID=43782 RepID=A0AAE0BAR8_9ROSI|nr:hypothetical protein Dsin_004410 [Dipteronia sinensis]